jgi:hypothetical protein
MTIGSSGARRTYFYIELDVSQGADPSKGGTDELDELDRFEKKTAKKISF